MFEVDQYERNLHQSLPIAPGQPYRPDPNIERISFMAWSEHCTECAAPACYQTCDLYRSRPDTRCRRFGFGIYKNPNFGTLRGYGAEVSFKQWGVLGAMGNTATAPKNRVVWAERCFQALTAILMFVGPVLGRLSRDSRWKWAAFSLARRLCYRLHSSNPATDQPDSFVLEVFNPSGSVQFQLAMEYAPPPEKQGLIQIRRQFRTTVAFPSGYSKHEFERALFQNFTEGAEPFLISLTPEGDTAATLVFLTADFVKYKQVAPVGERDATSVKCVVWDLDNTLWEGVLVEHDDVRLREGVHEVLQLLDERGVLSSIVSKNDHDAAWKRLEELGVAQYFVAPQINWSPKSQNVRALAKKLNVGLDSLAFVDDNAFELAEVKAAVPEVYCLSADLIGEMKTNKAFRGSTTAEARNRRRYYQEAVARGESETQFGGDYLRFLEYSQIRLTIAGYKEESFDRVAELVQRTNQLNFSGRKYDRSQLRTIVDDVSLDKYVLSCTDRFGAYGLVGFAVVRKSADVIEVQDFMLSCRVQNRTIERAFFEHLEREHNPNDAADLQVRFVPTARNEPARQALEHANFVVGAGEVYVREAGSTNRRSVVTVECLVGCTITERCATA
jgi:FkbH-like protein